MRRGALTERIQEVTQALSRPRFIRVRALLHIHERRRTPGRCPCCGSTTAEIVETRSVADLVLDLVLGDRIEAADVTGDTWQELVDLAKDEPIVFRCSRVQAELILDDTDRFLFASGGNRSSKTTAALIFLALQWLQRGGQQRRFWLVASTLPKAFRLLQKLFIGTGESPPILPRSLVEYMPMTHRASDTQTRMVDGSCIDLKYFEGDPGAERLKSDAIVCGVVDEAAHLPSPDSLIALRGRCVDAAGRLFFASTPRPTSFLKLEVVDPALEWEAMTDDHPAKISGEHKGARWHFKAFAMLDNPWLDEANILRDLKTLDVTAPEVQMDYFGSWASGSGPFWRDFSLEKHVFLHEGRSFAHMGPTFLGTLGVIDHQDITGSCVGLVFGRQNPHYRAIRATNRKFILGTDVNCHPMSSVVIQVSAPRGALEDRDQWHYWIMDVIRTNHGSSFAHAEQIASVRWGKTLDPRYGESPFAGCGVVADAKSIGWDPTHTKFGGDPSGIAEVFGKEGLDLRAPLYKPTEKGPRADAPRRGPSHLLVKRLLREGRLHIRQRAESLIASMLKQESGPNCDEPLKNDALASPVDGMRYGLWAIVHASQPLSFNR